MTLIELDGRTGGGLDLDRRVLTAETVLRTMGLTDRFAPLVVLTGHESHTVNNPHATALDCGACAGASGEDNARAPSPRSSMTPTSAPGLEERGIDIPGPHPRRAAIHDTVSDRVAIVDAHQIPRAHREAIARPRRRSRRPRSGNRQPARTPAPGPSGGRCGGVGTTGRRCAPNGDLRGTRRSSSGRAR